MIHDTDLYPRVAQEVVRGLRGRLSQTQLSKKLGYRTNQVYRWESGARSISWRDFVRIARLRKVELDQILSKELGFLGKSDSIASLIKHLVGQNSIESFSRTVGISRSVISKWIHEKSEPDFHQVLLILDLQSYILTDFLEKILDVTLLPSLEPHLRERKERKNLMGEYPEVAPILALMDLESYRNLTRHERGWFTKHLGFSVEHESMLLKRMFDTGYIAEKDQKYVILNPNIDTRGNLEGTRRLRTHWIEHGLKLIGKVQSVTEPHHFTHLVLSASDTANEAIRKATYDYLSAIRSIAMNDSDPKTVVRAISIQNLKVNSG